MGIFDRIVFQIHALSLPTELPPHEPEGHGDHNHRPRDREDAKLVLPISAEAKWTHASQSQVSYHRCRVGMIREMGG